MSSFVLSERFNPARIVQLVRPNPRSVRKTSIRTWIVCNICNLLGSVKAKQKKRGLLTGDSEPLQCEPIALVLEAFLQYAVDPVRLVLVPLHHRRVQVLNRVEEEEPTNLTLARAEAGDLRGN